MCMSEVEGMPRIVGRQKGVAKAVHLSEPARRMSSLDKALDVLDCFTRERVALTVTDVASLTGMDKSSASRFLAKLAQRGFLERANDQRYSIGLKIFELGSVAAVKMRLEQRALPVIEALAKVTDRTVQVGVCLEGSYIGLVNAYPPQPIFSILTPPGTRMPIHAVAAGKAICAFTPTSNNWGLPVDRAGRLPTFTPHTIATLEAFKRELETVRRNGYAVARQEFMEAQFTFGVAVFDRDHHQPVAAISVMSVGSETDVTRIPPLLIGAGAELSALLGARTYPGHPRGVPNHGETSSD